MTQEKKKRKSINLDDIKKALYHQEKEKIKLMKSAFLVPEIPLSRAGFFKDDKYYITPDALNISVLETIRGL